MNGLRLSEKEAQRYSRQLALPEVGAAGQARLKSSSVLVVGAGGLGTSAAVQLASAGAGRIGLMDDDAVELSNLHRQFLFTEDDVGRKKSEVLAERVARVNPNVRVSPYPVRLDSDNAIDFIGAYQVVVDATDNLPSRYLINDACVLLTKPDVYASAQAFEGQASVFHPPGGPCYRCVYPEPPSPESVRSCEETGVMGTVTAVMGALQATQAISLILGKGSALVGRLMVFNALDSSFDEVRLKRDPKCPACGTEPTITGLIDYEEFCGMKKSADSDVTPVELKSILAGGERVTLLDVREPYEYSICHLEGATLVPLGTLVQSIQELDRDKPLVAYCHTGVRSSAAVEFLRKSGFRDVRNLRGGIDAWADQVDPAMPRY